ncbi:hypothetical protein IKE67_02230 [bacterium]|nr:hypothetical protein [bacterium]
MQRKILILGVLIISFSALSCYAINNNEWDYRSKVQRQEAKTRYKKKLMPESGYMTVEEYEKKSVAKDKSVGDGDYIKKVEDSKMKYVPQPKYKLIRYNDPPGSPELYIDRKRARYDRQDILPGLIAPDTSIMLVPVVSYYAKTHSTDGDVYVLPLRKGMPDVEKVIKANFAARNSVPIFSTDRTLIEWGLFKTITPVDFSVDLSKVVAKEKIGSVEDGIWQTNILVYDFTTKKQYRLTEVREAVRYYWRTTKDLDVKDVRWDVYPLGFDANNQDRIIVAAYAYTGNPPRSLGTWSVDYRGGQVRMESLTDENVNVSVIGLKIIQDGVVDPASVVAETKLAEKYEKKKKKEDKKAEKEKKKELKKEYKQEVKEIKKNYKELKKEDISNFSRKQKIQRNIPFIKKGGKMTGVD